MSRTSNLVLAILLPLFLLSPWLAGLAGVENGDFENRDPTAFPRISLRSAGEVATWTDLGLAIRDRTPLRRELIRIDSLLDFRLFGDIPNREIVAGRDGWLFRRFSLTSACKRSRLDGPVRSLTAIRDGFAARGGSLVVLSSLLKHSLYPRQVPADFARAAECSAEASRRVQATLDRNGIDHAPDLRPVFRAALGDDDDPLFHRWEFHWMERAGRLQARVLLDRIAPGLWDESAVHLDEEPLRRPAEIPNRYFNLAIAISEPRARVERPGVRVSRSAPPLAPGARRTAEIFTTTSDGSALVPGTTLIVHDSFLWASVEALAPYFERLVLVMSTAVVEERDSELLRRELLGADRFVFQSVDDSFASPGNRRALALLADLQSRGREN